MPRSNAPLAGKDPYPAIARYNFFSLFPYDPLFFRFFFVADPQPSNSDRLFVLTDHQEAIVLDVKKIVGVSANSATENH